MPGRRILLPRRREYYPRISYSTRSRKLISYRRKRTEQNIRVCIIPTTYRTEWNRIDKHSIMNAVHAARFVCSSPNRLNCLPQQRVLFVRLKVDLLCKSSWGLLGISFGKNPFFRYLILIRVFLIASRSKIFSIEDDSKSKSFMNEQIDYDLGSGFWVQLKPLME